MKDISNYKYTRQNLEKSSIKAVLCHVYRGSTTVPKYNSVENKLVQQCPKWKVQFQHNKSGNQKLNCERMKS